MICLFSSIWVCWFSHFHNGKFHFVLHWFSSFHCSAVIFCISFLPLSFHMVVILSNSLCGISMYCSDSLVSVRWSDFLEFNHTIFISNDFFQLHQAEFHGARINPLVFNPWQNIEFVVHRLNQNLSFILSAPINSSTRKPCRRRQDITHNTTKLKSSKKI